MWQESIRAINRYLADERTGEGGNRELWYGRADMNSGKRTSTVYGALDAFFPAVLALSGDLDRAKRLQSSSFTMWNQHGIEPEEFDYSKMEVVSAGYPLRPEFVESTYYLFHYTKDQKYQRMGESLFRDFVKHCRTDEGYAALKNVFDLMAEQIESLVQAQRRLLGDISHELRSPLARLNVALELARQRSGAEAATALARIQHEAENLNEMIGQLLTLTRLQTSAKEIPKSEFDLCRLVREIADDAEFEVQSGNRSVRLESSAKCFIVGNEQLLRRAIENVVRNAVHYTAEASDVEITVQEASAEANRRTIEITVRDHGPGVPAAALEDIFRPFYRADDARDREAGGVGLGLAIAERAIQLHGGTVSAANAPDGGLIVLISLPQLAFN